MQAAQSGRLRLHLFFSRRHRSHAGRLTVAVFAGAVGESPGSSGDALCTRKRWVAKAGSVEEKLGGMSPVQTRKREWSSECEPVYWRRWRRFIAFGGCAQSRDSMALSGCNYSRMDDPLGEQVYKLRAIAGK